MTYNMSRWIAGMAGTAIMASAIMAQAQTENGSPIGHFEITRFEVKGNTLLPSTLVDQLVAPYAGKDRDFGSVQKALEALEAAYHQKGYNIVHVVLPEQELNHGVVQLVVVETRIGKITVVGNKHFSEANIRHSVPTLKVGETPNLPEVSASLKLANENPAKKTTLQMQTSDQEDQVNAVLQVVDDKPWLASVAVDNTGLPSSGRDHLTVQYQNADIGGADHVMSLQYTTSLEDPSQVSVYGIGYHVPLYTLGDSLDFYGNYSNINSGMVTAGIFDLAVSGKGAVFGSRYNHNLLRQGDYESKLIAGLDYKAFKNDISLEGTPLGNDVTVHPLSLTYTGTWAPANSTTSFYLSGLRNIPGGSNGSSTDFNLARAGASDNYSILRYGASYMRTLPADWQIRLALNGQLTGDALVPGEQFGVGGATSVRGFEEREVADDQGRATNAELYTPNLCAGMMQGAAQCRLLAFYDTGYVSHNHALPGELLQQSIGSVGLGLRLNLDRYLALLMDYAQVVDASDITPKGSHRLHFRMVLTY
jgi:hemolysin activation/secretion protein